jgi:hypothetical protein
LLRREMDLILRIIISDTWHRWFWKIVGPNTADVFDIELLEKYKRGE